MPVGYNVKGTEMVIGFKDIESRNRVVDSAGNFLVDSAGNYVTGAD